MSKHRINDASHCAFSLPFVLGLSDATDNLNVSQLFCSSQNSCKFDRILIGTALRCSRTLCLLSNVRQRQHNQRRLTYCRNPPHVSRMHVSKHSIHHNIHRGFRLTLRLPVRVIVAAFQLNLPMNRLRLDSQQTRPNRRAVHTYVPCMCTSHRSRLSPAPRLACCIISKYQTYTKLNDPWTHGQVTYRPRFRPTP